jgi:tRNA pseudouridine38-40 synthase
MRAIRLLVAYDGTEFHGWQVQPGRRTVQGVLEEALRDMLEHEDAPRVAGAGRTDAGVHARGQVASFECASVLPAKAFAPLLNRRLPPDVRVRAAADAPPGFHARHSARERRYAYRVLERDDVLMERFAWSLRRTFDWTRVDLATRALECEADFRAFAAAGGAAGTTVCRVRWARWRRLRGGARLDIAADHFLYHMVRNIVGTALRCARERDPAAAMREVLHSRDRARAAATAPARGVCLERVSYDAPEGT